jgi:hypothetical protein
MEIKNRSGEIIISGKYDSIKKAVESNRANLRGANLREADLRGADLREADLREADLYGADLRGANLCGADLREADLREADLYGADLRGADLYGANLREANLRGAIIFIQGSKHNCQYIQSTNQLRIGCHVFSLEYWLIMYDTIGRENNYTEEHIKEYHGYMKMLKNL